MKKKYLFIIISVVLAALVSIGIVFSVLGKDEKLDGSSIADNESEALTSSNKTNSVEIQSEYDYDDWYENMSYVSSSLKRPVVRPWDETVSVDIKVEANKKMGIGAFHFSPYWTKNYGKDKIKQQREFEDVLKAGYFNTIIADRKVFNDPTMWTICKKYGVTVWMDMYDYYDSSKENLDSYLMGIENQLKKIRKNKDWWELFNGFHFNKAINRGQKNKDFQAVAKALYTKYGRRNFMLFAIDEFTGIDKKAPINECDSKGKMHRDSYKYITDIAFESYAIDVRKGAPAVKPTSELPNIYDGRSYYTEHLELLKRRVGHPSNIWLCPAAYTCTVKNGLNGIDRADEQFCLAHVNFFDEILKQQHNRGGLMLYQYQQFKDEEIGLQSHIVVLDEDIKKGPILLPGSKKWYRYSKRLRDITKDYNVKDGNLFTKIK